MKKILFVTNHLQFSDGVARALLNLTNNLDAGQYDISVCAMFKKDEKFIQQFNSNIKVFSVFNRYFRGMHKLLKLVPSKIILNKILKEDYDVIVAYQFGYPTELLASKHIKCSRIAFMHGYDTSAIKYHEVFDKIVCVAQSSAEDYKKIVEFPNKVTYCHNVLEIGDIEQKGNDCEDISSEFELMKKPRLIFVGRLSAEKGVERTLNALAKIKAENIDFSYSVVGDGPLKQQITDKIDALNLQDNVKMFGFQKNPYKYLNLSDAYVCNSYGEGLCTACIEATILNLDILSTQVSGAKEIVTNPDVGVVCENNDEAIYNCLKDYIINKYPNDEWRNNKALAKQKWQKQNIINKFNNIINEVVK